MVGPNHWTSYLGFFSIIHAVCFAPSGLWTLVIVAQIARDQATNLWRWWTLEKILKKIFENRLQTKAWLRMDNDTAILSLHQLGLSWPCVAVAGTWGREGAQHLGRGAWQAGDLREAGSPRADWGCGQNAPMVLGRGSSETEVAARCRSLCLRSREAGAEANDNGMIRDVEWGLNKLAILSPWWQCLPPPSFTAQRLWNSSFTNSA